MHLTVQVIKMAVFLLLGFSGLCFGSPAIPKFNFSVTDLQSRFGRLYAKVHFDFEGEIPKNFYIDNRNLTDMIAGPEVAPAKYTSSDYENKHVVSPPRNGSVSMPLVGYELIPSMGYYKVHSDLKTWQDALERCAYEGAHLLILNSVTEADKVISLILKNGSQERELWIGLHDQYSNRDYVTIFNETMYSTGYTKWFPGDPWGSIDQNCISFRYESLSRNGLRDWGCSLMHRYICEKEI